MCSMPLLCLCLLLFPQFVDKQLHLFRLGSRKRVLAAKVKIIPEPLFILRVAGIRNRPFFEDGLIERQYIIRDKKHGMLSIKLYIMKNGILSILLIVMILSSYVKIVFLSLLAKI